MPKRFANFRIVVVQLVYHFQGSIYL
uniref:Uncharacterized protein n=1 Tax=Rhizophora mucronata TaxID=61149 RepID=A0A2P2Q1U2_RHIMU